MADTMFVYSFLIILVVGANADDTTVPSEVAEETGICRICSCTAEKVDCFDRNITTFFSFEDWSMLSQLKPIPTIVDLSENLITNITLIPDLPIVTLNLSWNKIEFIENASFKNLQEMKLLDLSHNDLTSDKLSPHAFEGKYSPEEYEPLESLRTLHLGYNDLHSLHQDLFEHIPELIEVDLSGNPLTTLDHVSIIAISSLPNLRVLRLRSCQLTEIPEKFLHTPRFLERLDISDNQLTAVPQELEETKNLVHLNLNQNPIVKLDMDSEDYRGFPRLRKLKELHMCNMPQLRRIEAGALAGLENLVSLHMSFNDKLEFIDPKVLARSDEVGENYDWPPIKELYLQSNNLTEIDSRLISRWDLLEAMDFSNNPFLCDCSTQWMVDFLVPTTEAKRDKSSESMVCQEPVEMRGYTMKHLHDIHRTMRCLDKYGNRPERDGAILMGCLIGVLLSVPIMLALMLLWRRGYFAFIGMRGPVDVSRAFYKRAPNDENII